VRFAGFSAGEFALKSIACLAVLVTLAGCQTTQDLEARVGNASNFQLCRAIFMAPNNVASIARHEATNRGLDCAPYASAIFQNEAQADAARSALAQQLLIQSRPAYSPPVSCQTYRVGNSLQTDCN
jgi:hypothetical protein